MKLTFTLILPFLCCLTYSCQPHSQSVEEPSKTTSASYSTVNEDEEISSDIHFSRPQVVQISHE
jgi:hypothetical protein